MVRVKERYILVNILYPRDANDKSTIPDFVAFRRPTQKELTNSLLIKGIKAEVNALFGDCGSGAVERTLSVKYMNKSTSTVILRVTREHLRYVWAALTSMRSIPVRNGKPCIFRVVRVSGTIRKVEEEAIRQARALMLATETHMAGKTAAAFDILTKSATDRVADVTDDMDAGDDGGEQDDEDSEDDGDLGFEYDDHGSDRG